MLRALGRTSEVYEMKGEYTQSPDALDEQQIRAKIIEAIDKDRPVIGIDVVSVPEWGVITGYQNNKQDFFCRSYFDDGMEDYNIAEKVPWVIETIGDKGTALSDEEAVRQSIAIARHVAVTEKFDNYYSGIKALEVWIDELGKEASFATITSTLTDTKCHANAWIYERFMADREVAVEFLRTYSDVFGRMSDTVLSLANIYEQQVTRLNEGTTSVVFAYRGDNREWSQELRNQQMAILRDVLELERKALQYIEDIMEGLNIGLYSEEADKAETAPNMP